MSEPEAIAQPDSPQPVVELSERQRRWRDEFRTFVDGSIRPFAGDWDRAARVPDSLIGELRERGWLGASVAERNGGGEMDAVTYGLLTEEIGRGCSSVRSLLTVHDMVALAVERWGSPSVRETVLPSLARGEALAALALSEPEVGSDAAAVASTARRDGDGYGYVLDGAKRWVTFGQRADWFLVLARADAGPTALLVSAESPGLRRRPMDGVVGTRASMLAEIELDGCRVPESHRLGREGLGFSHVASSALDHGRYSVAWGAVGIAAACWEACSEYCAQRTQFGAPLLEHQLVQRKLTEMNVAVRAARLLCLRAGYLRGCGDPWAMNETMAAKYFASRAAVRAANDAVQLHGGNGLSESYPVERLLRDAKVTEVIEGSSQILQIQLAGQPLPEL